MRTLQMNYLPPTGIAPVVGDTMCLVTGDFTVLEILTVRDNGEFLLRMGQDDPPDCE